jgi:hypothetical protein
VHGDHLLKFCTGSVIFATQRLLDVAPAAQPGTLLLGRKSAFEKIIMSPAFAP